MLQKNKMIYGLLILFVGFAMSFNTATAQVTGEDVETQNSFTGKVVDASNGQPLANVTVNIEGKDKQATTDQNGMFTFDNLKSGSEGVGTGGQTNGITFTINHEGYQEFSKTVQPGQQGQQGQQQQRGQGQEAQVTFELEPQEGGM